MVSLSNHLSGKSEYNGAPLMSFDTLRACPAPDAGMSGAAEIQGASNCNWDVYGLLPPYQVRGRLRRSGRGGRPKRPGGETG